MRYDYLNVCPPELARAVQALPESEQQCLQELRLRCGQPVHYLAQGKEQVLPCGTRGFPVTPELLQQIVNRATAYSAYAMGHQLRQGFLTLPGGHRLGICGQAVLHNGAVTAIKHLSSVNIRIARQCRNAGPQAIAVLQANPVSTLIAGPPGCGKTTLLRELIRHCSSIRAERVGVVDERMELAACKDGQPQFDLGPCTDILTCFSKPVGIYMLLRTMNPDWIAVDELTAEEDLQALLQASFCGARLLATAHIFEKSDLYARPLYARMCSMGLFQTVIVLDKDRNLHIERMNAPHEAAGSHDDHIVRHLGGLAYGTDGPPGAAAFTPAAAGHGTDAL